MSHIIVSTTQEEQDKVLEAIKSFVTSATSVREIAAKSGLSHSRVRYAILDLEESGKIKREPIKAFNEHYIRYKYVALV